MILTTYDNFVDSIWQNVLYFAQEKLKYCSVKHKKLYTKTEDNDGDVNNPICDSGTDNVNMLPF